MRNGMCRRVVLVASAAVMTVGSIGCSSISKTDYDAALLENEELRLRNDELVSQLNRCESDRQALATDNQSLARQVSDVKSRPSQPANDSGFANIPGVSVERGAGGELIVAVAGDVLFDSGKATLKTSAKSSLDQIAGVLNSRWSGHCIRIEGHTDTDPIRKSSWKSNEHLSAERALTVEQYLVGKGVNNDRVYSAAFGPSEPRSTKQESRRVEIVILAAAG